MTLEESAIANGWARRRGDGVLIWREQEVCPSEVWDAAVAAERERWRLLLTRIDVSISGCSANAVTARDWAHDMDAVQQMLRDELRA